MARDLSYRPKPIETVGISVPGELTALSERLAENIHDVWAAGRLAQGWRYGPKRDDAGKRHPDLVGYAGLPESEKEFDRATAMETVRSILALGFRIEPPGKRAGSGDPAGIDAEGLVSRLESGKRASLPEIISLWRGRGDEWALHPKIYEALASRAISLGESLVAYDILSEGLAHRPGHVRMRQLLALALANTGTVDRAHAVLKRLYSEGRRDVETLSLLGRTLKELAASAPTEARRKALMRQARDSYAGAFRRHGGYYPAINAAAASLLAGEAPRARAFARAARTGSEIELARIAPGDPGRYWALATLGEAALILGDWRAAETSYARAGRAAQGRFAMISSTRRQARLLMGRMDCPVSDGIEKSLAIPNVAVFASGVFPFVRGGPPRLPPGREEAARLEISSRLKRHGIGFGYSSAVCAADLLFLEEVLARKGEIHVVLPSTPAESANSPADIPAREWRVRLGRVLRRASSVHEAAAKGAAGSEAVGEYLHFLADGLARLRAATLDTKMTAIAAWESGGSRPAVHLRHWKRRHQAFESIGLPAPKAAGRGPGARPRDFSQRIMSLLFADAVGYSKLREDQIPLFSRHFLSIVAGLVKNSPHRPVTRNVWGDAVYFAFPDVLDAGLFALEMSERCGRMDWTRHGLPKDLNFRVALHAGPVYAYVNPITGRFDYTGAHVSSAARIEPITPPGQVYASERFAALAAAQGVDAFECAYVGRVPLAKKYGTFPLYRVRRIPRSRRADHG